jgi:Bacterial membrane protein YfhO
MGRKYGPYLLLLAIAGSFFWQFVLRGRIPIDASPLYQMRPWSSLPNASQIAHPVEPAKYYHNIDPIIEIFPVKKWLSEWMKKGEVPLWNPEIFSGTPFAANHHAAPWDLSTVFFLIFPPDLAFGLTLLFQIFAAGASFYLYCRALEISSSGSIFGALGFMLNSFFLHWLGLISFNAGLIWMPLIPAGIELAFRRDNWKYILISSAGLGFSFLSGMAQFWLFNVFLFVAYGFYRTWIHHRNNNVKVLKSGQLLLVALLLGLGLGAIQIFQTVGSFSHTSRGGNAALASLYSGRNHLSPRKIPTLIIPDLYSRVEENVFSKVILSPPSPDAKGFWGRLLWGEKGFILNRSWGYIGIAGFLFMLIGFGSHKPSMQFHKWMSAGVLLFQILLCIKQIHNICLHVWPGFDTLDHTRTIALYVLSASVLAAAGLDRISEMPGRLRNILYSCVGIAAALILVAVLLHAAPSILNVSGHIKNQAATNTNPNFSRQFFADAGNKIEASFSSTAAILYLPVLLISAISLLLLLLQRKVVTLKTFQAGILVIALIDLVYHGWTDPPLVYTERKALYPESSKAVEFLQRDPDKFRVYELQWKKPLPQLPLENYSMLDYLRKSSIRFFDFRSVDFVMRPNTLLAYNISSAGGYLSLYPGPYKELWAGRGMDVLKAVKPDRSVESWNAPWIGMQNIKYVAVAQEAPTGNWQPAYEGEGVKLLKVDSFCPFIYVVPKAITVSHRSEILHQIKTENFNPLQEVFVEEPLPAGMISTSTAPYSISIRSREPDQVTLDARLAQDGYMVITQNLIPGWSAKVDGSEQHLFRANYTFMCLPLKKGTHQVTLEYRPEYYEWSLFISIVSAIIIVLPGMMKRIGTKPLDVTNP